MARPSLAREVDAQGLRRQIIARSDGEAKKVVYAVYEDATGPAAKSGPQILLFIGGNLTGTSADAFVTSFKGRVTGAITTGAGSLGGEAVCVPATGGGLAECAWADNDTFGVIGSPTLSVSALAAELRGLRPMLEHKAR